MGNVTYIYQMKVQQLKVATYEKKRSEMEVIIRKKDLDIVTDTFRKVCDHVEEEGTKITLEHKCCLAYVVDCPGAKKSKLPTYNVPRPPAPPSMQDDQETVQRLKREVTRLRLMKEGLDEETKRSLEKVSATNKMLYKKEEEEKELNKRMEAERIQLNLNQQKEERDAAFNALTHPKSVDATGGATGGATGSAFLQLNSQKLRGNYNRRK